MRVSCFNIEEFLECLATLRADGGEVFENAVRVSISRRAQNESKTKFSVILQASCIAQPQAGGEYLLEVGYLCGEDRTSPTETQGTERACELRKHLEHRVGEHNLRVLPGLIGF